MNYNGTIFIDKRQYFEITIYEIPRVDYSHILRKCLDRSVRTGELPRFGYTCTTTQTNLSFSLEKKRVLGENDQDLTLFNMDRGNHT